MKHRPRLLFWLQVVLVLGPFMAILVNWEMSRLRAFAMLQGLGASWNEDKVFVDQTAIQDDDLRHLECFLVVDVLWASKTDIGDKGLEHLSNLAGLRALFIDETRVTDAGLVHLRDLPLKWLGLNRTAITDAGVVHLSKLTQLERLDLEDTLVSAEGVAKIQEALPRCQINR